jgi:glutamate-1-semialdehyde aminotransferase
MELLRHGIFHAPNTKFYLSTAHTDTEINQTLTVIEDALRTIG